MRRRRGPDWSKWAQRKCLRSATVEPMRPLPNPPVATVCKVRDKERRCLTFSRHRPEGSGGPWGWMPVNEDIEHLGAVVWLRPRQFLALVPPRPDSAVDLEAGARRGAPFANPYLRLEVDERAGTAIVRQHQGRGRMITTLRHLGDVPIPVHFLVRAVGPRSPKPFAKGWESFERHARAWTPATARALSCIIPEPWSGRSYAQPVQGVVDQVTVAGKSWRLRP